MKRKILAIVVCMCCFFSVLTGCNADKKEEKHPVLPEYSQDVEQMEFFAYSQIYPENRTVERLKEYKDAGMTMFMLGGASGYNDAVAWEDSECKKAFDDLAEAEIDKIILSDTRIQRLVEMKEGATSTLLGESDRCAYHSQEELNAYVKSCLETYYQTPGFYGIIMRDEPTWEYTENFGYVYKAIRAAGKELGIDDIYIHMNLLPLGNEASKYAKDGTYTNLTEAYTNYVRGYLQSTGADRMSVDIYAFRGNGFCSWFFSTLQIFSRECMAAGAEFTYCLQSFEQYGGQTLVYRKVEKSDMVLEINTLMGMGVNQFAYYTYMPAASIVGANDACFLTADGEKTNIYYYGQETMAIAQKMQKTLAHYDYKGMKLYASTLANFNNAPYFTSNQDPLTKTAVTVDNSYEFALLKELKTDNDIALVTELKDEKNDLYMYMLQNVIDPANGKSGDTAMTLTADFGSEYTYVAEFRDGNLQYVKLDGGKYTKTLSAGYAVYVVPLK